MAQTHKLRKYKSLFSTTLSTGIGTGTGDTITPASVSELPTDTEITLTFDRVNSSGTATPSSLERITGTISGGNFTSYTRGVDGTTEQAHSSNAVIEMIWNADDWNDMVDWGLTEHNQNGTHEAGFLVSSYISASAVTASKIAASAVIAGNLAASSVVAGNMGFAVTTPTSSETMTNKTLTSPTITGTGGTTAGMYGYDATDKAIFIGDGTTKQSIYIGAWNDYTPTYSGNGSMTYGTVTTTYAKYALIGRLVIVTIYATGTVGGTPNNRLTATLPLTAATSINSGVGGGWTSDGGAGFTGMVLLDSATTVGVQRYDATNYTAGAGRVISITFAYEI